VPGRVGNKHEPDRGEHRKTAAVTVGPDRRGRDDACRFRTSFLLLVTNRAPPRGRCNRLAQIP
jgi:hypothetical protein